MFDLARKWPLALWIGITLTCVWGIFVAIYLYFKIGTIAKLDPNSLGDWLAGFSAPLAFLWLIVATFLQKEELFAQRQELKLNREVMELQADQLKQAAVQLRDQSEILRSQKEVLDRERSEKSFFESISRIADFLVTNSEFHAVTLTQSGHVHSRLSLNLFGHSVRYKNAAFPPNSTSVFLEVSREFESLEKHIQENWRIYSISGESLILQFQNEIENLIQNARTLDEAFAEHLDKQYRLEFIIKVIRFNIISKQYWFQSS